MALCVLRGGTGWPHAMPCEVVGPHRRLAGWWTIVLDLGRGDTMTEHVPSSELWPESFPSW